MKTNAQQKSMLLIPGLLLSFGLQVSASADSITYMVIGKSSSGLPNNLDKIVADKGGEIVRAMPQIGAAIVKSSDKQFPAALQRNKTLRAVIPDRMLNLPENEIEVSAGNPPASGDDDFLFDLQWGHDAVNAPEAWNAGVTGEGVLVAVLDTGVDGTHPDLAPNYRADLSTSMLDTPLPDYWHYHGTHVAGTIAAADNAYGVIGVAPEAEVFSVQICGTAGCPTSATVAAVVYAADNGADVVNMSIGGLDVISGKKVVKDCKDAGLPMKYCSSLQSSYIHNEILVAKRAFQYANEMNTTVVVAAGNESVDADRNLVPESELIEGGDPEVMVHLPSLRLSFADYPGTIAASATAPINWCNYPDADFNNLTTYSNYGHSVIDFSAPGGEGWYFDGDDEPCTIGSTTVPAWVFDLVLSTTPAGWSWAGGTSMAAPHVAGVAALVVGENGGSMAPSALRAELKARAEDAGKPGNDVAHGSGAIRTGY